MLVYINSVLDFCITIFINSIFASFANIVLCNPHYISYCLHNLLQLKVHIELPLNIKAFNTTVLLNTFEAGPLMKMRPLNSAATGIASLSISRPNIAGGPYIMNLQAVLLGLTGYVMLVLKKIHAITNCHSYFYIFDSPYTTILLLYNLQSSYISCYSWSCILWSRCSSNI